jgi:hypothetical protein
MAELSATSFGAADAEEWNRFVAASRNGTFLFDRGYMDYHADRIVDASVVFREGGRIVALLPANVQGDRLVSHGGLTYGGIVLGEDGGVALVARLFEALLGHMARTGLAFLRYKTVPPIYHRAPAEEDRYVLFRLGARLVRRDLLTVVPPADAPGPGHGRRYVLKRLAKRDDVAVGPSDDWAAFWDVLAGRLEDRYATRPTHDVDEIRLLAARFPHAISLKVGRLAGRIAAGVVLYETATVVHAQYMAADDEARRVGVLDAVVAAAIEEAAAKGKWFDFGISTEEDGRFLNEGLAAYKESFGGRGVVHDFYEIGPIGDVALEGLANVRQPS